MNSLTLDYHESTLSCASVGTIRALLRDTALLVTTLSSGGHARNAERLRDRCVELAEQLEHALERTGYPEDVRQEVQLAQCALLDETALQRLPAESRLGWELKPLQVERFNIYDAGDRVFERLDTRMRESAPSLDLLECYSAILGMGFRGRYARLGEAKRAEFVRSLNSRIEALRSSVNRPFVADRSGRRFSDRFYRLLPWVVAGLACVAAAIVWTACAASLNAQVAHIVASRVARP